MGPDVAYGAAAIEAGDILREETPLPPEAALPGWHEAVRAYYRGMEQVSTLLMRSLARGLGLRKPSSTRPSPGESRPCG